MKDKYIYILIIIILILINIIQYNNKKYIDNEITYYDTIYVENTLIDTILIPKYSYVDRIITDTFYLNDTTIITIPIPIESKHYSNTNDTISYDAYVSGYKANLDSIRIKSHYPIINTTKLLKEPKNKFNHGVNVGIGYGVWNNKPDLYIGYGITYKF